MISTAAPARIALLTLLATAACKGDAARDADGSAARGGLEPATELDDGRVYNDGDDPEAAKPELLLTLDDYAGLHTRDVRWSANGRWLFVQDEDEVFLREFDASVPSLWTVRSFELGEPMTAFELLGGGMVVAADQSGTLGMWSVTPAGHTLLVTQTRTTLATIEHIVAAPGSRSLAVLGSVDSDARNGTVQIWRLDPTAEQPWAAGPQFTAEAPIGAAMFTPDGRHLFVSTVGERPGLVLLAVSDHELRELRNDTTSKPIVDLHLIPGSSHVLSGDQRGGAGSWRLGNGEAGPTLTQLREFAGVRGAVTVDGSADARWFVAGGNEVRLWPLTSPPDKRPEPLVLDTDDLRAMDAAIHPHGPYLATTGDVLRLWRINRAAVAKNVTVKP